MKSKSFISSYTLTLISTATRNEKFVQCFKFFQCQFIKISNLLVRNKCPEHSNNTALFTVPSLSTINRKLHYKTGEEKAVQMNKSKGNKEVMPLHTQYTSHNFNNSVTVALFFVHKFALNSFFRQQSYMLRQLADIAKI